MATGSGGFKDREWLEAQGYRRAGLDYVRGDQRLVPVYESKFISQYNHRAGTFDGVPVSRRFGVKAGTRRSSELELADPNYVTTPRYWIDGKVIEDSELGTRGWVLAFRDAMSATGDARSCIAAIVPRAACGDTLSIIETEDASDAAVLLGAMNSFGFDYLVKQKISGGHLIFPALRQIALPARRLLATKTPLGLSVREWIIERVLVLVGESTDISSFHGEVRPGLRLRSTHNDRPLEIVRAELDAAFLLLYGLDTAQAETVFDAFPVLERQEIRRFGDFKSRRLILERLGSIGTELGLGLCGTGILVGAE